MEIYRSYFVRARKPYPAELRRSEFRLVVLFPGTWADEISCELFPVSDDSELKVPNYQALSYVWGHLIHHTSARERPRIFVNDCPFEVTVNLKCALRLLRRTNEPIVLWVDALCINQINDDERSSQVSRMREIYSQASEVILFLGDGTNHLTKRCPKIEQSEGSITFCGDFSDESLEDLCLARWSASVSKKTVSAFDIFGLISILARPADPQKSFQRLGKVSSARLSHIFEGMRMMLNSRWWDRVWVVQEAVVASSLVVKYGNVSAPWAMLATFGRLYNQKDLLNISNKVSYDDLKILNLSSRVADLERFRQTWREQEGLDLLSLLRHFGNRKATDSRDKVFALLGLCDSPNMIKPNYGWDDITVYRQHVFGVINAKKSLRALSGDIGRKDRRDLPSWLPDWSATVDEHERARDVLFDKFDACGGVGSTILMDDHELRVRDGRDLCSRTTEPNLQHAHPIHPAKLLEIRRRELTCGIKLEEESLGFDHIKRYSEFESGCQLRDEMVLLAATLEVANSPTDLLPVFISLILEAYGDYLETELSNMSSEWKALTTQLISVCNKLRHFCHSDGQRSFISYGLITYSPIVYGNLQPNWLGIRGRCIGKVIRVLDPLYSSTDMNSATETIGVWANEISRQGFVANPASFGMAVLSGIKVTEAGPERVSEDERGDLEAWLQNVIMKPTHSQPSDRHSRPCDKLMESFTAGMRLSATKRALFVTEDGKLGLGPASIKPSDDIYVLPGGKMPFILRQSAPSKINFCRRCEGRSLDSSSIFNLVGDCFLTGAMDGEHGLPKGGIPDHIFRVAEPFFKGFIREDIVTCRKELETSLIYLV